MFANIVGCDYAVALNSCTAALHAILLTLGIGPGDEVVVPSNTFVATANAALYVGAKPVFADSDPATFNIRPSEIESKISEKTKAIIVVHVGGNPCDMKDIKEIAKDYKLPLIEDSAHAHGARYGGEHCGTMGLAGAFSFYPTKVVTTAEGGIVTTDDETLADKIRIIRNHGRAAFGPSEIVELGFNFRLSEIHSAIGLSQLKHMRSFVEARNHIAALYKASLSRIEWIRPQLVRNGNLSSYYAYIVMLTSEAPVSRDQFVKILKDRGVETSVLYHPVHLQPLYTKLWGRNLGVTLPVAEEIGRQSFALPIYNGMERSDVEYVAEAVKICAEGKNG